MNSCNYSSLIQMFDIPFVDCFVPECDLSKYTAENCTLSNRTSTFEQLWSDTNACIDGKNNSWACENCTEVYGNLNKKYDEIRLKTANKFCFTIKYWVRFGFVGFHLCFTTISIMPLFSFR